jgi:hypothetical protein
VIRRALPSIVFALAATWPALARAQATPAPVTPGSDVAQAEALFNEAKELRDAGRFAEACPKFAESRRLGPGIGVTLHLADCYEKVGKTQSAWTEFRNAEKLAREREDKRADVASARAQALEPRLNRLTLVVPVAAGQAGPEVIFDGSALPPDHLNVAERRERSSFTSTRASSRRPFPSATRRQPRLRRPPRRSPLEPPPSLSATRARRDAGLELA